MIASLAENQILHSVFCIPSDKVSASMDVRPDSQKIRVRHTSATAADAGAGAGVPRGSFTPAIPPPHYTGSQRTEGQTSMAHGSSNATPVTNCRRAVRSLELAGYAGIVACYILYIPVACSPLWLKNCAANRPCGRFVSTPYCFC